jgi:hypothetical protein
MCPIETEGSFVKSRPQMALIMYSARDPGHAPAVSNEAVNIYVRARLCAHSKLLSQAIATVADFHRDNLAMQKEIRRLQMEVSSLKSELSEAMLAKRLAPGPMNDETSVRIDAESQGLSGSPILVSYATRLCASKY